MDSSCSTYRVGKVQSIFSLPVNKKLFRYSVVPLFRIPRFTNSPPILISLSGSVATNVFLGRYNVSLIYKLFHIVTSGNRTPGSRFYSELLATFVCIHQLILQASFKALGTHILSMLV